MTPAQEAREMFEQRRMVVNDQKTDLMCILASRSFEAKAVLRGKQGEEITSKDTLKIPGFHLDADCSVRTHVEKTGLVCLCTSYMRTQDTLSCLK